MGERPVEQIEQSGDDGQSVPAPSEPYHPTPDTRDKIRHDLTEERLVQGTQPGNRYVRYDRQVGPFRRSGRGRLTASLATEEPRTGAGRFFNRVKQVFIGKP